MPEDLGERTEAPTPRRLEDARKRGQVAKSQDLASAIDLIGSALALLMMGTLFAGAISRLLERALDPTETLPSAAAIGDLVREAAWRAGLAIAPFLGAGVAVSMIAHLVQTGPLITAEPLRPRLDRLNPIAGFGRLFGRRNLAKTVLNAFKLIIVGVVTYLILRAAVGEIASLPRLHIPGALGVLGAHALRLIIALLAVLLLLGVADFAYQRWEHTRDLRMTREQVRDERREMEGDPKVKAARQRLARQIALQRINHAVPGADVVVTNPTHVAVALRYDQQSMNAPRVVAKGADYLALRIRQVASANRIPIVERPPLARALYAQCEVGQEIPPELYQGVAEVLAYVYRLEQEAAA
jgi:flagellar biosynthetic protein FlhB